MCLWGNFGYLPKYWVKIPYNVISLSDNFFGNILGKRVEVLLFPIKFDDTGFKKALENGVFRSIQIEV